VASLDRRQEILSRKEDISDIHQLEKVFQHYDKQFQSIDERRITQTTEVASGSTTDETVANLLAGINIIIRKLNGSDLTND
jgi:uncharacterized membrane protein YqiK